MPGARDLLLGLKSDGLKLAVASSSAKDLLKRLLNIVGAPDVFEKRASGDDAEDSKPDPDIVTAAITRARCPNELTVMIGDTPYDVEAATRAGIEIIGLTCGGWSRDDLRGAVAVYADPADLLEKYQSSVLARLPARAGSHTK